MRQFISTLLLLGYVMLVPFCFFGGMLAANMSMSDVVGSPVHQMNDCGMSLPGCAHKGETGGMGAIDHHISMYGSITQTPLVAALIMLVTMVVLLLTVFGLTVEQLFRIALLRTHLRPPRGRSDEPQSGTPQTLLTWLSLFENSPTFA